MITVNPVSEFATSPNTAERYPVFYRLGRALVSIPAAAALLGVNPRYLNPDSKSAIRKGLEYEKIDRFWMVYLDSLPPSK